MKERLVKVLAAAFAATMVMTSIVPVMADSEYPDLKQNTEQLTVGFVHGRNDTESAQRSVRQVEIEAEHRGWKLVDVNWDTDQETRDGIQNLITQNVDAILIANCSSMDAKVDLVQQARSKGIGVYNLDNR